MATVDTGCPVLEAGVSSCPRVPQQAEIAVFAADSGKPITTVRTGEDGRFAIDLPPGSYELRGKNVSGQPFPTAMPVPVVIDPGQYAEISLEFDSGVRGVPAGP
ncbi:carboxypeptidase-like regulatory domain-containing protein [Actinomycetes bacterium KLBMP 9797]